MPGCTMSVSQTMPVYAWFGLIRGCVMNVGKNLVAWQTVCCFVQCVGKFVIQEADNQVAIYAFTYVEICLHAYA